MDLKEWQENGVLLGAILGTPMWCSKDDLILHGDQYCELLEDGTGYRTFQDSLDVESEVCETCWGVGLSHDAARLVELCGDVEDALMDMRWARRMGVSAGGFPRVVEALYRLALDHEAVGPWARKVHQEIISEFTESFGDRAAMRAERLEEFIGEASGREGMLFLSQWARGVLESLSVEERELLCLWVDEEAEVEGILVRGPWEIVEHFTKRFSREVKNPSLLSSVEIMPEDEAQVLETAMRLLDIQSGLMASIETAMEVARRV